MPKRSAQVVGVAVLILGVVTALPFRHKTTRQLVAEPASRPELQLQQSDTGNSSPRPASPPLAPSAPTRSLPIATSQPAPKSKTGVRAVAGASRREMPKLAGEYKSSMPPMVPVRPQKPLNEDQKPTLHTLVDGDSLQDLAERYLGSRDRYREILRANPQLDPQLLPLQSRITIPPKFPPTSEQRSPRTKLVPVN